MRCIPQGKCCFNRVLRTRRPQLAREQMKRRDAGFGRLEERVGAEISLQLGTRRRMAESGDGGMGHELAPLRSEACTPRERAGPPGQARRGPAFRRGADPQHARMRREDGKHPRPRSSRRSAGRRRHRPMRSRSGACTDSVDLADEGEGQMEGILPSANGRFRNPDCNSTNGLPQPNRQRECDKQTWHGSFLRPVTAYRPSVWLHPRPSRFLDRIRKSTLGSYAILQ